MFNFLRNKKLKITEDDKHWVHRNFRWLKFHPNIKSYKKNRIIKSKDYSNIDLTNANELKKYLYHLAYTYEVNFDDVNFILHETPGTEIWLKSGFSIGTYKSNGSAGSFSFSENNKYKYDIILSYDNLKNPDLAAAVLAHEFAHIILIGEQNISSYEPDHEYLTDLTAIYHGFGEAIIKSNFIRNSGNGFWSMKKTGYLPIEVSTYAYALLLHKKELNPESYLSYFNNPEKQYIALAYEDIEKNKPDLSETYNRIFYVEDFEDKAVYDRYIMHKQIIDIKLDLQKNSKGRNSKYLSRAERREKERKKKKRKRK